MKKVLLIFIAALSFMFSGSAFSLTPFWFNGIALDPDGEILDNSAVNVRISIYSSETLIGSQTFTEQMTDQFGSFAVEVTDAFITPININAETQIIAEVQTFEGPWVISSVANLAMIQMNTTVQAGNIDIANNLIIIGDANDNGEQLPVGGDLTASNDGTTANFQINNSAVGTNEIADNAVTLDKIAHTVNYQFLIARSGTPEWSGILRNNSLQGDGISSALAFNLANTNWWTGTQTFADIEINDMTIGGTNNLMLLGTPAGGDLTGTYPNPQIAANAVGSAEIADGSVSSTDIADGTIIDNDVKIDADISVVKLQTGSHRQVILNDNGTNKWMQLPAVFVTNNPEGNIASITVQAAINELDNEKQNAHNFLNSIISGSWTGASSISTLGTITAGTWQGSEVDDSFVKDALTISGGSISSTPITGGSINGTPIGNTTRNSGAFTSLDAEGNTQIGSDNTDKVKINSKIESDMVPENSADREIGKSTDTERWKKAYFKQTGGINIGTNADNVEIQYTSNSHAKVTKPVAVPSAVISLTSNATYAGTAEAGLILYVYNTSGTDYTFQGITVATGTMKVFVYTGSAWLTTN